MDRNAWKQYEDIIYQPHHTSKKRPRMSLRDRAAQFSPFAALTGHGAAVQETARLTSQRIELEDSEKETINGKLQWISQNLKERVKVEITYFVPDSYKEGGSYENVAGVVKRFDEANGCLVMEDGTKIPLEEIIGIETIG